MRIINKTIAILTIILISITFSCYSLAIAQNTPTNDTEISKFEDLRLGLANSYNSQTITHAGYFIGFLAVFATLISRIDTLRNECSRFIKSIFGMLVGLFLYAGYRLLFWSWLGSEVLTVTPAQAIAQEQNTLIYGIQFYLLEEFKKIPLIGTVHQLNNLFPLILIFLSLPLGIAIVYCFSYLMGKGFKLRLLLTLVIVIAGLLLLILFNSIYLIPVVISFYAISFVTLQEVDLDKRIRELESQLKELKKHN